MRPSAQGAPRESRRSTPAKSARGEAGRAMAPSPVQLELFAPRPAPEPAIRPASPPAGTEAPTDPNGLRFQLLRHLNRLTGGRLRSLELTDNRRTILSVRAGRTGNRAALELRIHHSFTEAPAEVLEAVAAFVESKRGSDRSREALLLIREHFSSHRARARTRRLVLRPVGVALDLREVVADLNERYFEGRLSPHITWGKSSTAPGVSCRRRRTSTLQLGSYSYEDGLIRIHRVLDAPDVPRYVVEAVVYHELLHADMPPVVVGGRRHFHTPEFRRRERLYRHLGRAERWIGEHMKELLRARQAMPASRRSRKP